MSMSLSERVRAYLVWVVLAVLVLGAASLGAALPAEGSESQKPTVVLLHGAFADASGWNVIAKLQKRGYSVIAPANPLRSLAGDSAYIRSVLDTIEGLIVVADHSYRGMVLTNAATGPRQRARRHSQTSRRNAGQLRVDPLAPNTIVTCERENQS